MLAADLGLLRSDTLGLCCHLFAELVGKPRAPNNFNSMGLVEVALLRFSSEELADDALQNKRSVVATLFIKNLDHRCKVLLQRLLFGTCNKLAEHDLDERCCRVLVG